MRTQTEIIYMDATLTPNRSLSPTAFLVLMGVIALVSFVAGLVFLSMGAFPVLGFFGLDALAIWLAFRASFRAQRQETRIRITADSFDLFHSQPGTVDRHESMPTAFTRVDLHRDGKGPSELQISHAGRTFVIGRFLAPAERQSLAEALQRAINKAREERFASGT